MTPGKPSPKVLPVPLSPPPFAGTRTPDAGRPGWWSLLLPILLGAACAPGVPGPGAPLEEVLISETCSTKAWVANLERWSKTRGDPSGAFLYFMGQSLKQSEQRAARNDALTDATSRFVQYTGVEVSTLDEYLMTSRGKDSEEASVDVTGRSKLKVLAQALVRRVKARDWCGEKYERRSGGEVRGFSYVTSVLISVPRGEYDRVLAFKADKEARLKRERAEKWQALVGQAAGSFRQGLKDEKEGRILAAFANLDLAKAKLAAAGKMGMTGLKAPDAPTLSQVESVRQRLGTGLAMEQHPSAVIVVPPGGALPILEVRLFYHHGNRKVPVSGLPLLFMAQGRILSYKQSGPGGKAALPLQRTHVTGGRTVIQVVVSRGNLRGKVPPAFQETLSRLRAEFVVEIKP